ncbi:hypothetical protein C8T65DRAFT_644678 [Cerioporus squamosus]|nr:hypothetical protein C8T65DRAFT_644678 [Cerioporus squamosus]
MVNGVCVQDVTLPHPSKPWFCYSVMPVVRSLRPADPARNIEPAMCLPIAPNDGHPCDREPLHTEPPFPFANCYHWDGTALTVRVRAAPEGWDENEATVFPANERDHLNTVDASAGPKVIRVLSESDWVVPRAVPGPVKWPDQTPPIHPKQWPPVHPTMFAKWDDSHPSVRIWSGNGDYMLAPPPAIAATASGSGTSHSTSTAETGDAEPGAGGTPSTANTSVDSLAESLDVLRSTTVLGDVREKAKDADLLPIVDLWYDLTAHLTQDDIPSPLDFYRERHEIVK